MPRAKQDPNIIVADKIEYNDVQAEMLRFLLYEDNLRAEYSHGGVRSGKSVAICKGAQAIAHVFPTSKTLVARDTRVNLKNTTLSTFFGHDRYGNPIILPQLYDLASYNKTEGILTWKNGSVTCFWGLDAPEDIEKIKSTEWSAILLEEAPGIDIEVITFLLETRLSHPVGPHKMLLTSNTDTGHSDIYRLFYDDHNRGEDPFCQNCNGPCEFRTIASTTLANEKHLDPKYVKRLKNLKKTNPRYYEVYVMGKFMEFTKKVYPEFDPQLHVVTIPPGWKEPEGTQTVYGYDHGYSGAPCCLLTCKILPDGTYLFWDEWYPKGESVKAMAQTMKDREALYIHCADPSIRSKTQYQDSGAEGTGELRSVQDLYQTYGISMELANNDINGGIEKTKSLLVDDPDHPHPIIKEIDHSPRFLIARRDGQLGCPNLVRQMQKYRNKVNARGETNAKRWDPVGVDDHALDPARYIVNSPLGPGADAQAGPEEGTVGWYKARMREKIRKRESREVELSAAI